VAREVPAPSLAMLELHDDVVWPVAQVVNVESPHSQVVAKGPASGVPVHAALTDRVVPV
jgi:hypothetical protein